MSVQNDQAVTRSLDSERRPLSRSLTEALLRRMLRGLACGQLVVDTPAGDRLVFDGRPARPTGTIDDPQLALPSGASPAVGTSGLPKRTWRASGLRPILVTLLSFACHNRRDAGAAAHACCPRFWLKLRHALNRNSRRGSRRNIAAHYDLGNEFYEQWLDAGMTYSSGAVFLGRPDAGRSTRRQARPRDRYAGPFRRRNGA